MVRKTLEAAGLEAGEVDRMAASVTRDDGRPRYQWQVWNAEQASTPLYRQVMIRAIAQRVRWRREYERAKAQSGPDPPREPGPRPLSPRPPDRRLLLGAAAAVTGERSESRRDPQGP